MNSSYLYALNEKDEIVYIYDVETKINRKKDQKYYCFSCECEFIVKQGEYKGHHFCHKSIIDVNCRQDHYFYPYKTDWFCKWQETIEPKYRDTYYFNDSTLKGHMVPIETQNNKVIKLISSNVSVNCDHFIQFSKSMDAYTQAFIFNMKGGCVPCNNGKNFVIFHLEKPLLPVSTKVNCFLHTRYGVVKVLYTSYDNRFAICSRRLSLDQLQKELSLIFINKFDFLTNHIEITQKMSDNTFSTDLNFSNLEQFFKWNCQTCNKVQYSFEQSPTPQDKKYCFSALCRKQIAELSDKRYRNIFNKWKVVSKKLKCHVSTCKRDIWIPVTSNRNIKYYIEACAHHDLSTEMEQPQGKRIFHLYDFNDRVHYEANETTCGNCGKKHLYVPNGRSGHKVAIKNCLQCNPSTKICLMHYDLGVWYDIYNIKLCCECGDRKLLTPSNKSLCDVKLLCKPCGNSSFKNKSFKWLGYGWIFQNKCISCDRKMSKTSQGTEKFIELYGHKNIYPVFVKQCWDCDPTEKDRAEYKRNAHGWLLEKEIGICKKCEEFTIWKDVKIDLSTWKLCELCEQKQKDRDRKRREKEDEEEEEARRRRKEEARRRRKAKEEGRKLPEEYYDNMDSSHDQPCRAYPVIPVNHQIVDQGFAPVKKSNLPLCPKCNTTSMRKLDNDRRRANIIYQCRNCPPADDTKYVYSYSVYFYGWERSGTKHPCNTEGCDNKLIVDFGKTIKKLCYCKDCDPFSDDDTKIGKFMETGWELVGEYAICNVDECEEELVCPIWLDIKTCKSCDPNNKAYHFFGKCEYCSRSTWLKTCNECYECSFKCHATRIQHSKCCICNNYSSQRICDHCESNLIHDVIPCTKCANLLKKLKHEKWGQIKQCQSCIPKIPNIGVKMKNMRGWDMTSILKICYICQTKEERPIEHGKLVSVDAQRYKCVDCYMFG